MPFLPLVLAQCISSSVPVSDTHYTPAGGYSVSAVAANDSGAFGVWRHTHAGFAMITHLVDGMPMDGSGKAARAAQQRIAYGPSVAIASDGSDFLLATTDGGSTYVQIVGKSEPVAITSQPGSSTSIGAIDAVWDGVNYDVFATVGSEAILATVSPSGALVNKTSRGPNTAVAAIAPASRGNVFLAWRTSDGVLVGPNVLLPAIPANAPVSLAAGSDGYLIAWRDAGAVHAQRLGADAMPTGPPISFPAAFATTPTLCVVRERDSFLILWNTNGGTSAARIGGEPFAMANEEFSSAAEGRNGTIILTRTSCGVIDSAILQAGATHAGNTQPVSTVAIPVSTPSLATASGGYRIAWKESFESDVHCDSVSQLFAPERINSDGAFVNTFASAASGDSSFVFWGEYPGGALPGVVRVARFNRDGHLISNDVLAHGHFLFNVNATSSGDHVLVTWEQERESVAIFDAYAAVLSSDGSIVVAPALISSSADSVQWLISATQGDRSLIAWLDHASEVVAVDVDADLKIIRRASLPWDTNIRSFLAAGIHDDQSVIVAVSANGHGSALVAIDPFHSRTSTLPLQNGNDAIAKVTRGADDWTLLIAEGGTSSQIERVGLSRSLEFSAIELLFCVPARPSAISFDASGALAYAAPNERGDGTRLYLKPATERRRSVQR